MPLSCCGVYIKHAMKKALYLTAAAMLMVLLPALFAAQPASAHYVDDAKPGQDGHLDTDCTSPGSGGEADAVKSETDLKIYRGTTVTGDPIDLDDVAPNGAVVHRSAVTSGTSADGAETADVSEHYHRNTNPGYECWIASVVTIPAVAGILLTVGALIAFFGVISVLKSRLGKGGGAGLLKGGGFGMIIAGVMLARPTAFLLPFIFWLTETFQAVIERAAGLFS